MNIDKKVTKTQENAQEDERKFMARHDLIDLFLPDVFEENKDHIYAGPGKYARLYVIDKYPRKMHIGILNDLFEIDNISISSYVENIPDAQVVRKLTSKLVSYQSNMYMQQKRGHMIDYGTQQAVADLDNMRELVQTNRDRMSYVQIMITVWGKTLEELDQKGEWLEDICARKGMRPRVCVYDQAKAYITSLPYRNIKYMGNMRNAVIGVVASLVPIGNTEMSHPGGIYLGNNLYTNSPVFFDSFIGPPLLTNPMMAIFGMAGAGKSVTMKTIASRAAATGEWIIILDPENEYEKLIKFLGGQYFEIKSGQFSGINPFELEVEEDEKGQVVDIYSKLSEIRELLSMFCQKFREQPLRGQEISAVEEAINILYANKGITRDPESLYREVTEEVDGKFFTGRIKKDMPTLSDLREELSKNEATFGLSEMMKILVDGRSLSMFDGQTKIDLSKRLIGINLKHLTDEFMKFFAVVNVMSWIWGKFSNWKFKGIHKRVIVDEGWLFAKYPQAAVFLESIARRGRKYRISLLIASQQMNEFLSSESGKAIINQCATKFIMKQDPNVAREVAAYLSLSESCKEMISSFSQGEGLLMTDTDLVVMRMVPFDFEWDYVIT
ncbi:MAG TPA: conjugal transfer protein [Clostridiales bacterium]|nr:MAG: hypothetical protein A2Y18_01805 [Clostridiales bacterium GWD2_32_19]HCC06762.1 conjugal transfer protein [Clostridiales bacterium]